MTVDGSHVVVALASLALGWVAGRRYQVASFAWRRWRRLVRQIRYTWRVAWRYSFAAGGWLLLIGGAIAAVVYLARR